MTLIVIIIRKHTYLQQHSFAEKRKRYDSVLWQKPPHQQQCQKGRVPTQATPQQKFDYTAVGDRLRTSSWSNYGNPTGVVNRFMGPTFPLPTTAMLSKWHTLKFVNKPHYKDNKRGPKNRYAYSIGDKYYISKYIHSDIRIGQAMLRPSGSEITFPDGNWIECSLKNASKFRSMTWC